MTTGEIIQMVTIALTGTGVIVAIIALIWQSNLTQEQMKLNFFADYTKRYQEIYLNLPDNVNEIDFDFNSDKFPSEVRKKTIRYMRAYFDLCSEEYFLHQEGNINKKVWKEWKEGIEYTYSKKAFRDAWHIINLDAQFYGSFVNWINNDVLTKYKDLSSLKN